jgi:hypothetical protein
MPQFMRFSLFPLEATVTDANGNVIHEHPKTRVVVTDDEVYVYTDDPAGKEKAVVLFTDRINDFEGNAVEGWTVETVDDYVVTFRRSGGCSCGSRLKGFDPFPGLPWPEDKRIR